MKSLNIVIGFVAGATAGAGGMWFGMKKHFEKKADQKVAEARRVFHRMLKKVRENPEEQKPNPEDFLKEAGDKTSQVEKETPPRTYRILMDRLGLRTPAGSVNMENIHEIPGRDFGNIEFKTADLTWFSNDNQLVDPGTGKIFDELEELVGNEGTNILCSGDVEEFWIRNHELRVDIHVTMNFEDHYHEIYPQED